MSQESLHVIDEILGVARNDRVRALRAAKPDLAEQMQHYYDALFDPAPDSAAAFAPADRYLVAIRTASHTGSAPVVAWYRSQAIATGVAQDGIDQARNILEPWPIDDRLAPAMRHVDLIATHPVDSGKEDIDLLLAAGITPASIVVLSQVVAYVSYQLRLIATLRALGEPS